MVFVLWLTEPEHGGGPSDKPQLAVGAEIIP